MRSADIHYCGLLEIGRRIQSRELSSVDVTKAMLARIEAVDARLHSYATIMAGQALKAAEQADREMDAGQSRGPLHGVPIAVKDLLWTADAPTGHGMTLNRAFQSKEDATIVRRLREAGAVILGKLQMTEGAFAQHHSNITAPVNPWAEQLWPGVSSSGSGVATAAGLCFASLGTDTGGSIRFPSAANGVTGIKPTWGRVSRHGAFALADSMDHIGPMTRSAADAAAVLQVIAGADPKDPTASLEPVSDYLALMTRGFQGLKVGVDAAWALNTADEPTRTAFEGALDVVRRAGGEVREIVFPDTSDAARDWLPLCAVETAIEHSATFPSQRDQYGPPLAELIDLGHQIDAVEHQKRTIKRAQLSGRIQSIFEDVDLVLAPVTDRAALTIVQVNEAHADPEQVVDILRYIAAFDLTGHPTITLPAGFTPDGAPVAIQFVAPLFAEELLLRAGWAFQRMTDWHLRHPAV